MEVPSHARARAGPRSGAIRSSRPPTSLPGAPLTAAPSRPSSGACRPSTRSSCAQAMVQAKGDFNQVVYWSRPVGWKNQTLTPNPDTIYLMPFYNTKDCRADGARNSAGGCGASITGSIDDAWQEALEDVGPAGVDKGKGGKYLILPPGYKDKTPDGYIALPSQTYAGFALLRSNLKSGSERRHRKGRRLRQARQVLPAVAGGESAGDKIRRCDRRRVRQHHPLRPSLLPGRSTASCSASLGLNATRS